MAVARDEIEFYKVKNFSTVDSICYALNARAGVYLGEDLCPPQEQNGKIGLLFADPLFDQEAMKQKIFCFLPGSPTEKLGIKPLDMSHV